LGWNSRLVGAAVFSLSSLPAATEDQAVLQAFHVLNQFDIPVGACRRSGLDEQGNVQYEYTLWSSVSDLERNRYYVRTFEDGRIRMVDLKSIDANGESVLQYSLDDHEEILDVSCDGEIISAE
jgi:choloylglycine hydrolase